jgi:ribosomal protein S18 acetylase RimI-like enzyme
MSEPTKAPAKPKAVRKRKRTSNPPINIREMELRDIPAVFALGQRLFTAEKWPTLYRSWDEHELLQLFGTDEETCLVAESEGLVAGFALGRMMDKPRSAWRYGWLLWLGVDPTFKRRGIASRLIKQITERFIDREARIMLVDTDEDNEEALAFFRRHGFGQELRHVYLSENLEDHPYYREKKAEAKG